MRNATDNLDIALDCAAQPDAAPATLIRAARDFAIEEPAFAAQVGLHAIVHLLAGRGYEPSPFDIDEAVSHVMAASLRIGQGDRVLLELRRLASNAPTDLIMSARLKARLADIEKAAHRWRFVLKAKCRLWSQLPCAISDLETSGTSPLAFCAPSSDRATMRSAPKNKKRTRAS